MPIDVSEVVLEGVYAVPDSREHIVRDIVSGKVFFDARKERSDEEWSAGHAPENPPRIEEFAAACLSVVSLPRRYSRHDSV